MTTLRLIMEKYINKTYPQNKISYNGDLVRIRYSTSLKTNHPLYNIYLKNGKIICLVGIEPNIIMYLCPQGIDRIYQFQRDIQLSLLWIQETDGNIYGTNNNIKYPIEYVLTGLKNVTHSDGNPLNNIMDNLIILDKKKMKQNGLTCEV